MRTTFKSGAAGAAVGVPFGSVIATTKRAMNKQLDSSFFYNSLVSISGLTTVTTRVLRVTSFFDFGLFLTSDSESEYEGDE